MGCLGDATTGDAKSADTKLKKFEEIKSEADLLPPGAKVGTVPSDLAQSTGLERLEILGKMEGIDIFDMKTLDASRKGTMQDPIAVRSFGDEQYCGCTGYPVDSHPTIWLTMSRDRPITRCVECGSVYKMDYVGPQDDPHDHHHGDHHGYEEPKNFSDFVRPEYRY
ncbi:MAG: Cytochrome c oxidase subunit 4 [Geoglossum simile]|nr:MAG: Cytochrome c oxidase subunit 4 [Geoglossum simile]